MKPLEGTLIQYAWGSFKRGQFGHETQVECHVEGKAEMRVTYLPHRGGPACIFWGSRHGVPHTGQLNDLILEGGRRWILLGAVMRGHPVLTSLPTPTIPRSGHHGWASAGLQTSRRLRP